MALIETNIVFKDNSNNYFVFPIKIAEELLNKEFVGIGSVTTLIPDDVYGHPKRESKPMECLVNIPNSYESHISGTSKLIREHNKIFIARRKNNLNDKNSVCINDNCRDMFFKVVKGLHPGNTSYAMYPSDGVVFDEWSKNIDSIYTKSFHQKLPNSSK